MAENVTLAQVVRLIALGRRLDRTRYDVHFACSEFDPLAFANTGFREWPLWTIPKEEGLRKVERGQRLYELGVLRRYVEDELRLFERVKPDLVVGDFRLSLATSAAVAGVPFATLINAYWSPHAVRDTFPMPDHPIVSLLGVERAARFFPLALPRVFAHFAAPMNALRKHHGLPAIGGLLEVLTFGDATLYADVPELCPTQGLPGHHHYLGPVAWAPEITPPSGLLSLLEAGRRYVYVTLGSSGRVQALGAVLEALRGTGLAAVVATAGRAEIPADADVVAAEYVPGELACRHAEFVVTNGGSSTGYQALAAGKPVLGVPSNLDQYLATDAIERAGAGVSVRAAGVGVDAVRRAMSRILTTPSLHERARALAAVFEAYDCHARFSEFLDRALERRTTHASHA